MSFFKLCSNQVKVSDHVKTLTIKDEGEEVIAP